MSEADIDIVRNFTTAIDNNEQDELANFLADDFTFAGWTPKALNKEAFLTVIGGLKAGIPSLMLNLHNVQEKDDQEEGDTVTATWQVAGYQTDSFVLPPLGLPPIPQMGRSVSLPTEDVTYLLENGKIKLINVQPTPGGGIKGILHQLGFDAPIVQ